MKPLPTSHLRIARPSHDLRAAERFWVDGLGLDVLFRAGLGTWLAQHCPGAVSLDDRAATLSEGLHDHLMNALKALARAVGMSGQGRKDALMQLATQLHADAPGAADQAKVHTLAAAVTDLAGR